MAIKKSQYFVTRKFIMRLERSLLKLPTLPRLKCPRLYQICVIPHIGNVIIPKYIFGVIYTMWKYSLRVSTG